MPTNIVQPLQWFDYRRDDPLADSLAVHLPFWEGMGLTAGDVTDQDLDGTLTNMTEADWVPSDRGWALDFDGINDHVQCPTSLITLNASGFTLATWVLARTQDTSANAILQTFGGSFLGAYLTTGNGNRILFSLEDGATRTAGQFSGFTLNTWHHVCGVANNGNMLCYLDGTPCSTTDTYTPGGVNTTLRVRLGEYHDSTFNLDGQLASASIWNRALSPGEVQELYLDQDILARPLKHYKLGAIAVGGPYRVAIGESFHTGALAGQSLAS